MSTPAINPPVEAPQTDLQQAEQAARAAANPPPDPALTPAAGPEVIPAPPQPYTITQDEQGNTVVQYQSGEVYKGTPQEVTEKLAKSVLDNRQAYRQVKGDFDRTRDELGRFTAQQPPPETGKQIDPAAMVLADMLAPTMGFSSGAEMTAAFGQMQQTVRQTQEQNLVSNFFAQNADYPVSPANGELLERTLIENQLPMSPAGLRAAHLMLKADGKYEQAVTIAEQRVPRPNVPPQIRAAGALPQTGAEPNYEAMSFKELETLRNKMMREKVGQ